MISICEINYQRLPIKAHYFFFMAAMAPMYSLLPVYGKQLGVSTVAMGSVTAILPIICFISKPLFGFLVDYFHTKRKIIFICILIGGSMSYVLLYFLPKQPGEPEKYLNRIFNYSLSDFCHLQHFYNLKRENIDINCQEINYQAQVKCLLSYNGLEQIILASVVMKDDLTNDPMLSYQIDHTNSVDENTKICDAIGNMADDYNLKCKIMNIMVDESEECLYQSVRFWGFVLLMSIGSISFNVTHSITDAICFDVLGKGGHMEYGRQRVWGTFGVGVTALTVGYAIDRISGDAIIKSYTPAFILVMILTIFDVICCIKLKLPIMPKPVNIVKNIIKLLKMKAIAIFLIFAVIVGILDSFIIYFMLWYLEDLAVQTGHMDQIKLIEGLIIAAGTLGGEVVFLSLSGKIIEKFGYGYSLTFCFICYAIRLGSISLIPNPWWAVLVELFMQGSTFSLCYAIIVGFANLVAPPGTSATVQGIIVGIDTGFGFAIGGLLGGNLYKKFGGPQTFRLFAGVAVMTAITYFLLYMTVLRHQMPKTKEVEKKVEE